MATSKKPVFEIVPSSPQKKNQGSPPGEPLTPAPEIDQLNSDAASTASNAWARCLGFPMDFTVEIGWGKSAGEITKKMGIYKNN